MAPPIVAATATSVSSPAANLPRLPACRSCHDRKVKCDSQRPQCEPCANQGTECIMLDPDGGPGIPRRYIHELEQKSRGRMASGQGIESPESAEALVSPATTATQDTSGRTMGDLAAVLQGGGLSFMSLFFTDPEWRKTNATLLRTLAAGARPSEAHVDANALPSAAEGRVLFDAYLGGPHIQHPFLLRQEVNDLYALVFMTGQDSQALTNQALFRTFMILAVASVVPHRKGLHKEHPFGYYLAAMRHFEDQFLGRGISAVQDLLLVCRFGIYHHTGTSIWDVARLGMRICIEQGLHKKRVLPTDLLKEQLERRVFWTCYLMDRYSSYTLNRPFAIADRDIQVELPVHADDEAIMAAAGSTVSLESFMANHAPAQPNGMSVALCCISLRKISSRIHYQTSQLSQKCSSPSLHSDAFLASGQVYRMVEEFTQQLRAWRESTPRFARPRCLYEADAWYDLLEAREELLLVRRAVDLIPKREGLPCRSILMLCLQCAVRTIVLYTSLFRESKITYTRSYFQIMFTAGLSILFCISVSTQLKRSDIEGACSALHDCEETLKKMAIVLPDASPYSTVFKTLHRNILQKLDGLRSCHHSRRASPEQGGASHPYPALEPLNIASQGVSAQLNATDGGGYDGASFDVPLPFDPQLNGYIMPDSEVLNEEDPSGWASLAYDTLWSMGNYSFAEVGDFTGMPNSLDFSYNAPL